MEDKTSKTSSPPFGRLDVGCGNNPTGDVNVDFSPVVVTWQLFDKKVKSNLDVRAHAQHLPFRDSSFRETYSSHTIEHLDSPAKFVRELERVAKEKVIVICPSRWMKDNRKNPFHKWTMTRTWFSRMGYSTEVNWDTTVLLKLRGLPFQFFWKHPHEIIATKIKP